MIPQSAAPAAGQMKFQAYPSHTYRADGRRIAGYADGEDAIRQTIAHILGTERYAYAIYGGNYGAELARFAGKGIGYLRTAIAGALSDALLQDDRITGVKVTGVSEAGSDGALVEFMVECSSGPVEGQIMVNS